MRYWTRTLLGIALIAGAIVLTSTIIFDLFRIGSCGSDGTYVSVRPCPDGTGLKILGLLLGIFVVPFAGMGLLGTRAPADRRSGGAFSVGALWFLLLFACMGAAAYAAGHGAAAPEEPGLVAASTWVGVLFMLMGGPALLVMLWSALRAPSPSAHVLPDRAVPPVTPSIATLTAQLHGVARARRARAENDDVAVRLRELDRLRVDGLISDEEHAAKRRAILADL